MEPDNKSQEVFENPEPEGIHSRGASFKSITSYASFRSCRTYKSLGGTSAVSRSSYKSCVSKLTRDGGVDNPVFKDCHDDDLSSMYSVVDGDYHSYSLHNQHNQSEKQIEKQRDSIVGNIVGGPGDGCVGGGVSPDLDQKEEERGRVLYLAYVFSILAGITITASTVLIRLVPQVHSWTLLLVRSVVQILSMLPFMLYTKSSPLGPKGSRIRIYLQGVVSGVLLLGIFLAVQRLPLTDVAAIFYTAPVFTLVLSSFILREHFGIIRCFVGTLLLAGVILLSKPTLIFTKDVGIFDEKLGNLSVFAVKPESEEVFLSQYNVIGWPLVFNQSSRGAEFGLYTITHVEPPADLHQNPQIRPVSDQEAESSLHTHVDVIGIIAAIAVPILSAYFVILTRQSKEAHYSVLVFWFGVGGFLVSLIGFLTLTDLNLDYSVEDVLMVILIAFLGLAGNILMTKALSWVPPGKVMVLRSFEIIAAYILHVSVFDLQPVILDLVGIGLVLLCLILMIVEDLLFTRVKFRYL